MGINRAIFFLSSFFPSPLPFSPGREKQEVVEIHVSCSLFFFPLLSFFFFAFLFPPPPTVYATIGVRTARRNAKQVVLPPSSPHSSSFFFFFFFSKQKMDVSLKSSADRGRFFSPPLAPSPPPFLVHMVLDKTTFHPSPPPFLLPSNVFPPPSFPLSPCTQGKRFIVIRVGRVAVQRFFPPLPPLPSPSFFLFSFFFGRISSVENRKHNHFVTRSISLSFFSPPSKKLFFFF